MSFKFINNIIEEIKKLDGDVNDYNRIVKTPYLPSIAYVNWGIHLAGIGDTISAEEKLTSSTLMVHQTPEAYINLGILKIQEKKYEEAKEFYLKAIKLDNANAKAYCFLANVLTETGNFEEAENNFEIALKFDPNNADINLNWGIALVRQKKFTQAKEKFELSCKFNNSNFSALYFLGLIDMELFEFEQAKDKFKTITSVIPNHYEAFYYLSYIFYKEEAYQESLDNALKSLEFFNKKTETYMLIAENYMNLNKKDECIKYYELGQAQCNVNYFFYISWGISLQHFNCYEESKEKFEKAMELNNECELAYASLGISYLKLKDYATATELLKKTLKMDAKNVIALENLGQIYFENQEYGEAIKCFHSVLGLCAKFVWNYEKIAKASYLDGNIENAKIYYQKSIEYQPDKISPYLDYAEFLFNQGDLEQALKKLQHAYKIDDKNLKCLNLLFQVNYTLAKQNFSDYNIEKAFEFAEKIQKHYPDTFIYIDEKRELEDISNSRR